MVRSKQESAFIDQETRRLCAEWARLQVQAGELPDRLFSDEAIAASVYKSHAFSKGWIGKKKPRKLTAAGWHRATQWLKK
tara:strand:- start:195 stop:434 length:240 start_codon:yes stop_codon:yes gene_type:complete